MPVADSGWLRNRLALEARHNSPGTTRWSSQRRQPGTSTDPDPALQPRGKPMQAALASNSTVSVGTVMGAIAPNACSDGSTWAKAGYRVRGS